MGFFEDRDERQPPTDPFSRDGSPPAFRSPIPLRWVAVAVAMVIVFMVAGVLKSIYVDWIWFDSVSSTSSAGGGSFASVFQRVLVAKVSLFAAGALLSGIVIGLNIWLARRFAPTGPEESFIEEVDPQAIRRIVTVALVAGTLFMAVIFGSVAGGGWATVLTWLNGVSFGVQEAAFNRDASFYLFDLPAYHLIQGWALGLLIIATLGAGAVYALSLSLQGFELNVPRGMRIHLSILVGLILIVVALGMWLSIFNLATAATGIVAGATYADLSIRVPVRWLLTFLGVITGVTVIANAFLYSGYRLPLFALGIWTLVGIVGGAILPGAVQRYQVDPNQLEKERPYIERNIAMTRYAFGLSDIVQTNFDAQPAVTVLDVAENQTTIDNIRLLDARPLRDTFNELQSLRPFYFFSDIDIDRYEIDGKTTQVMISARELNIRQAEGNWTRERLQLTHGYGAVIALVSEVTEEGQPILLTKDIPPVGDVLPLFTETAQIYFGELTDHYVIVNTEEPEFDYPLGETSNLIHYGEDRGIRISSALRRFALAWELGDTNLLISSRLNSGSRLLMERSLDQRISKVAPFLMLDGDPYVMVLDGKLLWIQDAYTTADSFPYSQTVDGLNYIRNSVKITVDAITGDTTFYLVDERDPVVRTWANIFPDLFTPFSDMPPAIREHLRYPQDLFRRQAELYLKYHITEADTFFIGEDVWGIPNEKFRQQEQQVEPYYVIMKLPGEEREEFVLILPFTPKGKRNTIAWMAGRSDGQFLGTLRAYRFPTDRLIFGPAQIEALIDADEVISPQLSLWDQKGSEVIRGNLLVIPVGDSFLFVEPIYLQAETSRFPVLTRVVVVNGNQDQFTIAMEPTLDQALEIVLRERVEETVIAAGPEDLAPVETPAVSVPAPPAGSLLELLEQAAAAAEAAETDLGELRTIIEAIRESQASSD